ncbi:MAG: PqqD family protein [Elusimicrobiota bacterium]
MPKNPPLDCSYRHSPDTAWRRIEDESVVLNLKSSVYYSLNDTAAMIWEALGEGLTPQQTIARMCAEFDETPEAIRRDVSTAVADLLKERLIQRSDA